MEDKEFNEKYESLKKSKFKQQKLPGWRPTPTLSCITIIFISFSIFFIIFGILILVFIAQVKEIKIRYDDYCYDQVYRNISRYINCSIIITATEKMAKPIMIYYQIDDFSQNHRVYMDSKSDKQLNGEEVSKEDLEKSGVCENALLNKDIPNGLEQEEVAIPCGLMAKSYLRDRFFNWKINGEDIEPKVEDIVYKTDKEKYGNVEYNPEKHWINMTDEHFMIWMRPNPFANPRKLWGIIEEEDIEKDSTISLTIENNNYITYKKYIILSTRNVFGGKNSFLGICYLIFGIICLTSSVVFINAYNVFHRKK